jgi:uncharacterized protein
VLTPVTEDSGPLAGMTLLEGMALARGEDHGFDTPLYRELSTQPAHTTDISLIPYFAWGNRGTSEMSVWLPLAT